MEVTVKFIGYEHTIIAQAGSVRRGEVKNVMLPNVQGVGFSGLGIYASNTHKVASRIWHRVLERCYSELFHKEHPTYEVCTMEVNWHNFQNFAEWFYCTSNFDEGMYLDKDVIKQGNKVYGANSCAFVTREVNNVITARNANRGACMLGVSWHLQHKKFYSCCNNGKGISVFLGLYATEIEAHEAYKEYKYYLLKSLAEKQIHEGIKKGLLNWVIPKY